MESFASCILPDLSPYTVRMFLPPHAADTLVVLHSEPQQADRIWNLLPSPRPALAVIGETDWNRDFSPWPAPRAFSGGEDFAGGADRYLETLLRTLLPAIEAKLPHPPRVRCLAGYSLAGLFAVYACTKTDRFDRIASLSGSLWYDGFLSYLQSTGLRRTLDFAFFSLGDRETRTKNPRMAAVADCTAQVCSYFADQSVPTAFQWASGGHFDEVDARIANGITQMLAEKSRPLSQNLR